MAPSAVTTPNIMTSPGWLFGAIAGTSVPTNTVAGSVFTDAWAAAWEPLGATAEGSTFAYTTTVEPITVAEFFDPIRWETVSRQGSFAFNMADFTAQRISVALNKGVGPLTPTSGTGATALHTVEPPTPGGELRIMLGWESQDSTMRIIMRQCINGSEISAAFQKAPSLAVIPVQFQFEVPTVGQPFSVYTAGAARAGVFT